MRVHPTHRPGRVAAAQLACEAAGAVALTAAAFTLSLALGLAVLGTVLLIAGNVRIGGR
jgi:hypothetical protein